MHQKNAWFDRRVSRWWFWEFFLKKYKQLHGELKGVIISDGKGLEGLEINDLPNFIFWRVLPPKVSTKHQAADMGMIAKTKLGYKLTLLDKLLSLCDDPERYAAAKAAGQLQRKGARE